MTLNERELFEEFELSKRPCAKPESLFERFDSNGLGESEQHYVGKYVDSYMQEKWELWQKAKAKAVPETHLLIPKEPNRKTIMAMACVCLGSVGSGPEFLTLKEAKDVYSALVEKESGAEG
ncbi:hypothetical protein PJT69_004017 [Acinetobacter baumannii]|nr:hypothetical protein [Acinetobacter baumannii]EKV6851728.1 hypothetical protein [Acinetobacter baumannii]EKW9039229.1 hypothetical protein [Acinetobacter baumannii]ELB1472503.1 hypothetical protein [Acinetobacter baumannii]